MQVKELAADMCPAGRLLNATCVVQPVEAGIGIGLQRALEIGEMAMRMLASAVRRISKPDCRGGTVASRAIIANICPQAPLLGSTLTWRQHRNGCVISVQFAGAHDVSPQSFVQRIQ